MKNQKKYVLTEEHKEILKTWKDKWIKNALSTKPMDEEEKKICIKAVNEMYEAAKLPLPKNIVFVPSPFVLRFAGGLAETIWENRRKDNFIEISTRSATLSATSLATDSATRSATLSATDLATYSATSSVTDTATRLATSSATDLATYSATSSAISSATLSATLSATDSATSSATYSATLSATDSATLSATDSAINSVTTDLSKWYVTDNYLKELDKKYNLNGLGIYKSQTIYNAWQGGNQWSGWCSYQSFYRDVARLDISHEIDFTAYNIWEELCLHSGPRVVCKDFCMISDRPELLLVDNQNRPHNLNGPFCKWRDGSALYAVHGVYVPAWIIERKQDITSELIDKEENIEVRRIMLQIYGEERYLKAGNYEVLDTDKDQFGRQRRLLRKNISSKNSDDDEPIVRVEVINSSPELDNTYNTYYLPVDPELRPILPGIPEDKVNEAIEKSSEMTRQERIDALYLGKAQKMTCHNAVASTFGKYGHEYGLNGQIRQGDVFIEFKDGSNNLKFRES